MKAILSFLLVTVMASAGAATPKILVWGDSLSAGFGIDQPAAWPSLLPKRLSSEGYRYEVINASISGETTAGGRSRLPDALSRFKPAIVIIELGANDGLRGQALPMMRENLSEMIRAAKEARADVLLLGMRLPPNFGPAYTQKFQASFTELAAQHKISLIPFFLEQVAARRELFQSDTIHPTAEAQPLILQTIWQGLKPLLKQTGTSQ